MTTTDRTCSIDGCESPLRARGWCGKHYSRWLTWGDPLGSKPSSIERFLANVEWSDRRYDGTRCLVWTGSTRAKGYGAHWHIDRRYASHRWLYERWVGPIPDGLVIDHLCRNPPCCNPAHLEPVTSAENTRRGLTGQYWAAKTHCPQGHEYTEENTYISPGRGGTGRCCRICKAESNRRRRRLAA